MIAGCAFPMGCADHRRQFGFDQFLQRPARILRSAVDRVGSAPQVARQGRIGQTRTRSSCGIWLTRLVASENRTMTINTSRMLAGSYTT